jgi:hypothetical protein
VQNKTFSALGRTLESMDVTYPAQSLSPGVARTSFSLPFMSPAISFPLLLMVFC